ncbi:acyl-CoA thioesterase [Parapedomonas caeni]
MEVRDPVLRVVPRPADINMNGHIFGGWILSQMDIAGGMTAHTHAQGPVATVAIESMTFHKPILLGDVLSLYAKVIRVGRTSLAVQIDVWARRRSAPEELKVTEGVFTFVALDKNQRPRPVDRPDLAPGDL